MRTCPRCKKEKPFSEFPKLKRSKTATYTYCRECANAKRMHYYYANRKNILAHLRVHRQKDDVKIRRAHQARKAQAKIRLEALRAYGGPIPKCCCCQEADVRFLTLDHINRDGKRHRQEVGNGSIYRWLRKNGWPPGLRVMCFNCNLASGIYGVCPHVTPA